MNQHPSTVLGANVTIVHNVGNPAITLTPIVQTTFKLVVISLFELLLLDPIYKLQNNGEMRLKHTEQPLFKTNDTSFFIRFDEQ